MSLFVSVSLSITILVVVFQLVGRLVEKIEDLEKRIDELEKL